MVQDNLLIRPTNQVFAGFGLEGSQGENDPLILLMSLEASLRNTWTDEYASIIVRECICAINQGTSLDPNLLARWIREHPNNPESVLACMSIVPPVETEIVRLLSTRGSQKMVFLCRWLRSQRKVVLKRIIGTRDDAIRIIDRENQTHPLSIKHPNIIETHPQENPLGETFLVEEYIPEVLDDTWQGNGIQEPANLLYDIAKALHHLHSTLGLVHGDVKPDNIAKSGGDYILLDFGICRPFAAFTRDATATGSLRTRAPELLATNEYKYPDKADIWALGATVYNTIVHRYPLFKPGEIPPKVIEDPEGRQRFEEELAQRSITKYEEWVRIDEIPETIREPLAAALCRDPEKRPSAHDIIRLAERALSPFIRSSEESNPFSPLDEVRQLAQFLAPERFLRLMPSTERYILRTKVAQLIEKAKLDSGEMQKLEDLLRKIT